MRVLITGGAGFIGSHIVDETLRRGHQTCVVDDLSSGVREQVPTDARFVQADIRDADAMARVFDEFRPEAVCHQAAQMSVSRSVREPVFDAQVNVLGLLNVLDNAARVGTQRVVFASSGGVLYGDVTQPAPENTPAAPISPYGISKWVGEQYLQFFAREHGLSAVALRYSNVYGPRQNPHGEAGVVAIFSTLLLNGESATINGDGEYVRDYVYATDVADANVRALEKPDVPGFIAVNIGTARPTDVNELAAKVHALSTAIWETNGRQGPIPAPGHGPARAGDLRSNLVSPQLAAELLGWRPEVQLEDGLRNTVAWFADRVGLGDAR